MQIEGRFIVAACDVTGPDVETLRAEASIEEGTRPPSEERRSGDTPRGRESPDAGVHDC